MDERAWDIMADHIAAKWYISVFWPLRTLYMVSDFACCTSFSDSFYTRWETGLRGRNAPDFVIYVWPAPSRLLCSSLLGQKHHTTGGSTKVSNSLWASAIRHLAQIWTLLKHDAIRWAPKFGLPPSIWQGYSKQNTQLGILCRWKGQVYVKCLSQDN